MTAQFNESEEFSNIDFAADGSLSGDYEACTFNDCNLSGLDLSDMRFEDCEFTGCDLSLIKVINTGFRDVRFTDSKLLGIRFEDSNKFGLSMVFERCKLDMSVFRGLNLTNVKFKECSLKETDLGEANLTGVALENCDLSGAVFEYAILEKADLRTAYNFNIDPETNRLRGAKFSAANLAGLLRKYEIVIE